MQAVVVALRRRTEKTKTLDKHIKFVRKRSVIDNRTFDTVVLFHLKLFFFRCCCIYCANLTASYEYCLNIYIRVYNCCAVKQSVYYMLLCHM